MGSTSEESVGSSSEDVISTTFRTQIYKVLKMVHPELEISREAMLIMDGLINALLERIAQEATTLVGSEKHPYVVSSREIQMVARVLLPGELARNAIFEGTEAVKRFYGSC